jgi:hypothetical protein
MQLDFIALIFIIIAIVCVIRLDVNAFLILLILAYRSHPYLPYRPFLLAHYLVLPLKASSLVEVKLIMLLFDVAFALNKDILTFGFLESLFLKLRIFLEGTISYNNR